MVCDLGQRYKYIVACESFQPFNSPQVIGVGLFVALVLSLCSSPCIPEAWLVVDKDKDSNFLSQKHALSTHHATKSNSAQTQSSTRIKLLSVSFYAIMKWWCACEMCGPRYWVF